MRYNDDYDRNGRVNFDDDYQDDNYRDEYDLDEFGGKDDGYDDREYDDREYDRVAAPEPRGRRMSPRREQPTRPRKVRVTPRYRDDEDEWDYNEKKMEKKESWRRRHPVLMNLVYVIAASVLMIWMMLWFLDFWTFHGEERVVPDVKGQQFAMAEGNVDLSGLKAVIADSVFDSYSRPGTVVEQTPIAGAKIKKGGTVYLTVVAFSPKLITVPDFYNVSVRQARSMFNGLGINEVREVPVISEYQGLVLGAKFNGVALQPGARIPISAVVTLEVGSGMGDTYETGEVTDTLAIDETIEELNIE